MTEKRHILNGTKILNIALLVSFILTVMVPLTGIHLHKLSSTVFLLLCLVHAGIFRKKLGKRSLLMLAVVLVCFVTGIFGMILDSYPVVLKLHRGISIAAVFFLSIHIFVYHKKMCRPS